MNENTSPDVYEKSAAISAGVRVNSSHSKQFGFPHGAVTSVRHLYQGQRL